MTMKKQRCGRERKKLRPLKLTLTAFGPYKNTETIDFTELENNDLYVISGNTGAGKTTIFDGICFALYGTASGEDRGDQMMLRSDFADDETHTSAELEFELKGRTYRILRQLGHIKQGNKTKTGDRYEFFELIDGQEIPCVDRQIVSEINQKVESLMGLTEDQFKQIVMLPQGEFRKLLTSETENKEEILRRLFKTDSYNQMSEQLRQKKAATEKVYNQVRQTRDTYIRQIEAVLPVKEDSELARLIGEEHPNVHHILAELTKEINGYAVQMKQDEKAYQEASGKLENMQEKIQKAKHLNERFDELAQKEMELQTLEKNILQIEQKEKQLEKAERAGNIEPEEDRLREWIADQAAKEKDLSQTEQALKIATDSRKKAVEAYEQEKNNQEKREEFAKDINRLREFYPTVEQIEQTKRELSQLKQAVDKEKSELDQLNVRVNQQEKTLETNQEQIKLLEEQDNTRLEKHNELKELREKVKIVIGYLNTKQEEAASRQEYDKKKVALDQEKSRYNKLEATWLNNQAAVLATHLHDGEACPVCGSHEHPNKANHHAGEVSREQLDQVKQAVERKQQKYQQATKTHSGIFARLQDRENELNELGIPLAEIQSTKEQITKQGTKLKKEVDHLDESKKRLDELKKATYTLQEQIKQFKKEQAVKEKSYNEMTQRYTGEAAAYQERIKKIPEALRQISVLKQKINDLETEKSRLDQLWETAEKNLQTAKENYTKAETNAGHAATQLKESKEKRAEAEKRFNAALKTAQFDSVESYRDAKLESSEQQAIKEEIKQFHQQLAMVKEQVRELRVVLENKEKVDLTHLEAELAKLREANEQAYKQWTQSDNYHKRANEKMKEIADADEDVEGSERQLRLITDLHDMIRGQNTKKISFERYLQIDYLDQIIEAANQRLRHLSNGQYALIRSDRQEARGRQSGLALDVYDEYTGQTRDVKSLSGGEKFNASLCLALGMSDVIQSFQGNISIDTMFIDEGFGSLDEESLNKSIDTLIDLQETGRMVGVISHVKELKDIFPAILEVNKTKEGYSETRFIVK